MDTNETVEPLDDDLIRQAPDDDEIVDPLPLPDLSREGDGRWRCAIVRGLGVTGDAIAAYMPGNYRVIENPQELDYVVIKGQDNSGWNMEGYVRPRLASGLYTCEEVDEWAFYCPDSDRNAGWTNHCFVLQYVCRGFGETPELAAREAESAGRVPEKFYTDTCIAIRPTDEHGVQVKGAKEF